MFHAEDGFMTSFLLVIFILSTFSIIIATRLRDRDEVSDLIFVLHYY